VNGESSAQPLKKAVRSGGFFLNGIIACSLANVKLVGYMNGRFVE